MKSLHAARLGLLALIAALGHGPAPLAAQSAARPSSPESGPPAGQSESPPVPRSAAPSNLPADEALAWANRFRAARGLRAVEEDPALQRCARLYARELAASGRLSHRDARGRTALERYREAGGSAPRVGELLGFGPELATVASAWESSPAHAAAALRPGWTHAGAGSSPRGSGEVWVLLLAEQPVRDFRLQGPAGGDYLLTGRFRAAEAAEPFLLSGLRAVPVRQWRPGERFFAFLIPAEAGRLYHRLGYRTANGRWVLTDAFYPQAATSSAETAPR
jgi:uncharacterized protein YkwD